MIGLLLALITAVVGLFLGGRADPISNAVGVVATPVRGGIHSFVSWVEGLYDYSFRYDALVEENARLKQKNAEMEETVRQAQAALRENERLRKLTGLTQRRRDLKLESVTVTAHSTSNWEANFTISKGENGGISADDCVVDEYGNLVGIVSEVGANWAKVSSLVDTDTELGGLIGRIDTAAILEGDFALMGEGKLKLTYIPENSQLIAGDEVLTSGKGGMYPAGLVVGSVEAIHDDASGMTSYAVIAPAGDLSDLRQVFVVTAFDIVE
ncbi:MAG: rod shape-determining protein MreC [Pseudoflavonifractor sp.]